MTPHIRLDLRSNARRLLSVIEGDWSPYLTVQQITPLAQPAGTLNTPIEIEIVYTNFDLLRHDIHVLFHAAAVNGREAKP